MAESSMFAWKTVHMKKILLSAIALLYTYPSEMLPLSLWEYARTTPCVSWQQRGEIQFMDPDDLQMNSDSYMITQKRFVCCRTLAKLRAKQHRLVWQNCVSDHERWQRQVNFGVSTLFLGSLWTEEV